MSWLRYKPGDLLWLEISFSHQLDGADVTRLLTNCLSSVELGLIVFETEASKTGVRYRVGTPHPGQLSRLLRAHLPDVTIQRHVRPAYRTGQAWTVTVNTAQRALNVQDSAARSAAILSALAVRRDSVVVHQVILGRRLPARPVGPNVRMVSGRSTISRSVNAVLFGPQPLDAEQRSALADKQTLRGVSVTVRLLLIDPNDLVPQTPKRYLAAVRTAESAGTTIGLRRDSWSRALNARTGRHRLALNLNELQSLLAWPYGERSYPGIDRDRSLSRPDLRRRKPARIIGRSTHPGQHERMVGNDVADAMRHHHVLGPSGVGKSTLLAHLILQDIAAGRSVVVIDPKGDLVDDVLARIPNQHLARTVVLDPSRNDYIVGLNPLHAPADKTHLAVDGIVHVFKNMHERTWGPRTEDILHASLLTLAGTDHANLTAIPQLLTDAGFRQRLRERYPVPSGLVGFWSWYDNASAAERSHVTGPLLNKLRPLVLRPNLTALLGADKPFDLKRVFTERKVLLVPLRQGLIGPEVTMLLGALLFNQLWQTIRTRQEISPSRRHPSLVYADEFQDYTRLPLDFADMLAQARGLGVGLILAHQNLSQLEPSLRSVISANAQNKTFFRLGADDATVIAKNYDELRPKDFTSLPGFEVYTQHIDDHELRPITSALTAPLPKRTRTAKSAATALARQWGTPPKRTNEPGKRIGKVSGDGFGPIGHKKRGTS